MIDRLEKRLERFKGATITTEDNLYVITFEGKTYKDTSGNRLWRTFNQDNKGSVISEEVAIAKPKKKQVNNLSTDEIDFRAFVGRRITLERYLFKEHTSSIKGILEEVRGNVLYIKDPVRMIIRPVDRSDIVTWKILK